MVSRVALVHAHKTYQFQKALGCGIVVSSLIGQVQFAHLINTAVYISHETTDRSSDLRLQKKKKKFHETTY